MDHTIATNYAVERYMLGEMPESERDRFEEHFFNCAECAEDVRDFSQLAANTKAVLGEPPPRESQRSWLDGLGLWWSRPAYAGFSLAAIAVLTSVTGYQAVALRRHAAPQAVASFVLHPEARGDETVIGAQKLGDFLLLEADVPVVSGQLKWEVRGGAPSVSLMAGAANAPEAGASLKLLLPAAQLKPAQYILTIRPDPAAADPLDAAYRFRID